MSRATRTIAVSVLVGLLPGSAWACIERVIVRPTGRITSDMPIALEIHILTPTSPGHLAQPTQVAIVGNQIIVDLYAEGGPNDSPDRFVETVNLGPLPVGTYGYEVRQHATEYCRAFTAGGTFCIDQSGCSGSSCTCPLFAPRYNIIDLGTLGGGTSVALGVNDKGQVVGSADTPQGLRHAYLWENGVMIDLGTLGYPPPAQSEAWDINNQGVVVGPVGGGDPNKAFIWENGVQTELGNPQVLKSAYGINDARQVVGIYVVAPSGDKHAFLWENGTMTDLGTLGGTFSIAWDVNNVGQVVGKAFTMSAERAFIWQNGLMSDLGTLGGSNSVAFGINDAGQVVGSAAPADGFLTAFLWENGVMTDLGALGGFESSRAQAINNHGLVVGTGSIGQKGGGAFVYDPQRGMRYLEDMIPPDSGWSALSPRDINNAGWIVGSGTGPAGPNRAFLMTPARVIPTISEYGAVVMTLLILTCGTIIIVRARARRGRAAMLHQNGETLGGHSSPTIS